jgi:uncharacterized membrane protein
MGSIIVGYGVVLAGLAFILRQVAPELAGITFIAGLVGSALTILWGVVALAGHRRRIWAVLTLAGLAFVVLTQTVHAWSASAAEAPGKLAGALLLTLLMVSIVGMLMYLLHGERPPEFYRTTPARGTAPPQR